MFQFAEGGRGAAPAEAGQARIRRRAERVRAARVAHLRGHRGRDEFLLEPGAPVAGAEPAADVACLGRRRGGRTPTHRGPSHWYV